MFKRTLVSVTALGIAIFLLSACAPSEQAVTDAEKATILAFAEPKVDAQMAAIGSSDYESFRNDYIDEMKASTTPGSFEQLQIWLKVKAGDYQSRAVTSVTQTDTYYIVNYTAAFSKDNNVSMRVVFEKTAPNRIAGLWFDSPRMRE
jgi:hypothetical protein